MRLARSRAVAARPLLALVRPRSARAAAVAATARRSLTTAAASDDSSRATLASQGPLELYSALVQTGELRGGDGRQIDALRPLQRLFEDILQDQATKGPPPPPPAPPVYPPPEPKGPDMFIPIFVATALGGYGLILVFDAAMNGFCVPFLGQCFGVADKGGGWGSL